MARSYNRIQEDDTDYIDVLGENLDKLTNDLYGSIYNWKDAVRNEDWDAAEIHSRESAETGEKLHQNLLEYRNTVLNEKNELDSQEYDYIRCAEWAIIYLLKAGSQHEFKDKEPDTGDFVMRHAGPEESKIKLQKENYDVKTSAPYENEAIQDLRQNFLE